MSYSCLIMKLSGLCFNGGLTLLRHTNKIVAIRSYGSKALAKENVVPINEHTLLGRIVLFLNGDHNRTNNVTTGTSRSNLIEIVNNVKCNNVVDIKNLNCTEIEDLLYLLVGNNYVSNQWDFQKIFNVIDFECCSRLETFDSAATLRLLNAYIHVVPNRITKYKFYETGLNHLLNYVQFLTKSELLQTIFYVGLQKKSKQSQSMLKTCLKRFTSDDVKKFSVEELCIVCNSTFKTSTFTNTVLLETVKATLNDNLYLLKDPALFVTLVKTIRHNRYQDEDLLNTISCAILFNSTFRCYSFTAFTHILAMYADFAYYDEALLSTFVDRCVTCLQSSVIQPKTSHRLDLIRLKDVTRFLWSLSSLGYRDMDDKIFKDVIVPRILKLIESGLHKSDVEDLLHCVLYMWILNYQAVELVPYVLTNENVRQIRESKSKAKERLNLLLTCIFFENRILFKDLNLKLEGQSHDMSNQLQRRTTLKRVYTILKAMTLALDINKFDLSYQIPFLNICGITGYKKKTYKAVYIEVLDDYVCVKNKEASLIGPMQMKLRILNDLDEAVVTVYSDEVDEMTDTELKELLQSELELLC